MENGARHWGTKGVYLCRYICARRARDSSVRLWNRAPSPGLVRNHSKKRANCQRSRDEVLSFDSGRTARRSPRVGKRPIPILRPNSRFDNCSSTRSGKPKKDFQIMRAGKPIGGLLCALPHLHRLRQMVPRISRTSPSLTRKIISPRARLFRVLTASAVAWLAAACGPNSRL